MIRLRHIEKAYAMGEGSVPVLLDISLEVPPAARVAIMGDSGAGKSTLLNIIGTIDTPDGGAYSFNGRDVLAFSRQKSAGFRNKHIGFVFQAMYLLPEFTALENVMIPALIQGVSSNRAAEEAGGLLEECGLGARVAHRPAQLSGGEKQRVAIARALINKPDVVLADEPTGNLDVDATAKVMDLLQRLNRLHDVAIVLVTHNNHLASEMDIGYKLERGRLIRMKETHV